jgi:hypothetical protein
MYCQFHLKYNSVSIIFDIIYYENQSIVKVDISMEKLEEIRKEIEKNN